VKGAAKKNEAVVVPGDHPPDVDVLVLALKKTAHANPDVLLRKGIVFHGRYVIVQTPPFCNRLR